MKKPYLVLVLGLAIHGCVNLEAVRGYARESARFTAYTELSARFRDTYRRERPYLVDAGAAEQAEQNDKKRKALYPDLIRIHKTLALYMKTLATLAGDDAFDLSGALSTRGRNIQAHPDLGIGARQVEAYSELGQVIARWVTAGYQQSAVRSMIKEGDAPLQLLLAGMGQCVRIYRKTHLNEKRQVLGLIEVQLGTDPSKNRLLAALANVHVQEKQTEYALAEKKYAIAEQGIARIAKGHQELREQVEHLGEKEAMRQIKSIARDIGQLRGGLMGIHG